MMRKLRQYEDRDDANLKVGKWPVYTFIRDV